MLVNRGDPGHFGRCVDSACVTLNKCLRMIVVAFLHKVETALDLFSSDRVAEAGRRGRW